MHPQLDAIVAEFRDGSDRLHRLADAIPGDEWGRRPRPEAWSVGECVAHLNLTTAAFRPLVEKALNEARRMPKGRVPRRYSRGLIGGLLWRALSRPGRFKTKTAAAFVPGGAGSLQETMQEFDRLQDEQIGWVRAADGLPITAVRLVSPFDRRVRYNLFAALSILAAHQHRHLAQAEEGSRVTRSTRLR
ncbi:MAG TPA: DinB family protein [Vicinamibacterales bacterium]|nr:DinB family protein [Vicinamibacterales bacterium]